jgi:hypothetical protein
VSGRSGGGGLVRPGNRGGLALGRRVSDVCVGPGSGAAAAALRGPVKKS